MVQKTHAVALFGKFSLLVLLVLTLGCNDDSKQQAGSDRSARSDDVAKRSSEAIHTRKSEAVQVRKDEGVRIGSAAEDWGTGEGLGKDKKSLPSVAKPASIAWSPSGESLVVGGKEELVLWKMKTGEVTSTPARLPTKVAFSADGKRLFVEAINGVLVLNGATLEPDENWNAKDEHSTFAFHDVSQTLATVDATGTMSLWSADLTLIKEIETDKEGISGMAFAPDGKSLAAVQSFGDDTVMIYDVEQGKLIQTTPEHNGSTTPALVYSPDGRFLFSADSFGSIYIWEAPSYEHQATWSGHSEDVSSLLMHPSGDTLISSGTDGAIKLWNLKDDSWPVTLRGHLSPVQYLALSPDGSILASVGCHLLAPKPDELLFYDMATALSDPDVYENMGDARESRKPHDGFGVQDIVLTPDGKGAISFTYGELHAWDLASGETRYIVVPTDEEADGIPLALSPDGKMLACGRTDGDVVLRDATTGEFLRRLKGERVEDDYWSDQGGLAFSPQGDLIVHARVSSVIGWEPTTGERKLELNPGDYVPDLAFADEGKTLILATWSSDDPAGAELKFVDVASGNVSKVLSDFGRQVNDIAVSPDGKMLATSEAKQDFKIWSLDTYRLIGKTKTAIPESTLNVVNTLVFADNNMLVLTTNKDMKNSIVFFDIASGGEIAEVFGNADYLWRLRVTKDGQTIVSASEDGTVKFWDVPTR